MRGCLVAAGREAGPVVEVDDAYVAFGRDDAVAAIDHHIEDLGRGIAYLLHLLEVELDAAAFAVDGFVAVFAVAFVERIEPVEIARAPDAVEFHEVADKVAVDDGAGYASQKILLKHFLGLFGMAHVRDILLVHGVKVTSLNPAGRKSGLFQLGGDGLVGVDHQAFGVGDVVSHKYARHALAGTVLDAEAGVDDKAPFLFERLKLLDRTLLATHIDDDWLADFVVVELIFRVDRHLAAAFAQLVDNGVEDGRVIAYMIGGICAGSHYGRDFLFCHIVLFYTVKCLIVLELSRIAENQQKLGRSAF